MLGFKKYLIEVMSKYPNLHLFKLKGKLKIIKESKIFVNSFFYYFLNFQCSSHRPISVADLYLNVNHIKSLYHLVYKICFSYISFLWGYITLQPLPLRCDNGPSILYLLIFRHSCPTCRLTCV